MKLIPQKTLIKTVSFGITAVRQSTQAMRQSLGKKIRMRKSNIEKSVIDSKKLLDKKKKDEKEKFIESTSTSASKKPDEKKNKKGSFIERLLNAIGLLIIGFLLDKLPKIIEEIKKVIKNITGFVDKMKKFAEGIWDIMTKIGNVIKSAWSNIKNFDLQDKEGKLRTDLKALSKELKDEKNMAVVAFQKVKDAILNFAKDSVFMKEKYVPERFNEFEDKGLNTDLNNGLYKNGVNVFDGTEQPIDYVPVLDLIADTLNFDYTSANKESYSGLTEKSIFDVSQLNYDDVGRFGFTPSLLLQTAADAGISEDDPFNAANQDKMMTTILQNAGMNKTTKIEKFAEILNNVVQVKIPQTSIDKGFSAFKRYAQGGFVSGPEGTDKVPAMLTAGEFVMSTGAVKKYGTDTLASMNAMGGGTNRPTRGRYASGGQVTKGINTYNDPDGVWIKQGWDKDYKKFAAYKDRRLISEATVLEGAVHYVYDDNGKFVGITQGEKLKGTIAEIKAAKAKKKQEIEAANSKKLQEKVIVESDVDSTETLIEASKPIDTTIADAGSVKKKVITVPMPIINNTQAVPILTGSGSVSMGSGSSSGRSILNILRTLNSHYT